MNTQLIFVPLMMLCLCSFKETDLALNETNIKQIHQEVLNSLKHEGSVRLSHSEIKGSCEIKGDFICKNSKTQLLIIDGNTEIIESTIASRAAIKGTLSIQDSEFIENLEFTGTDLFISKSLLNSIFIFAPENFQGTLQLTLEKETQLKGSIIFDGAMGQVILKEGSQYRGQVVNGSVIQQ